jgi:Alpha amylase, catalytic domain
LQALSFGVESGGFLTNSFPFEGCCPVTDQLLLSAEPQLDADWWRQAVVYQVYPRSFADSNADGIGDLAGVASRIGYLAALGVDAIWLSPFYPSALVDGGYDVADYRNVAPELGTLDDFDALVRRLPRSQVRLPGRATSFVMAAVPTGQSRPRIGSPTSAGRPGPGCPTDSGTAICSRGNNPT